MVHWYSHGIIVLLLLTLVGCSSLPFPLGSRTQVGTAIPETALSPTTPATLVAEKTLAPNTPGETAVIPQPTGGATVRIWLPPEFTPDVNSPASRLLKARLDEYAAENPDIRLEVRVKALDGAGGMLEALVAANAAAPLALPDLVLLPRALLESAALKGLLYPYDGLTSAMDDQGWFDYANQLAHLKASMYGLPFAGDALVLAYHPALVETTPHDLKTSLSLGDVMLVPASDPQAIFTLCMYLAKGESLQDAAGRPWLDKATLIDILEFDQQASQVGVMPYWLSQYSNDTQVWDTFVGDQFPMAVMWASTYLKHSPGTTADLALVSVPTPDGLPFTLATGWSWALAGQDPQRRLLSAQLAEYLVETEFLAEWTYEAGYLPPRIEALQSWQDPDLRKIIEQISFSAHLVPPADMISSLGPALQQAVVDVIKAQSDPQTAAQSIIDQIGPP